MKHLIHYRVPMTQGPRKDIEETNQSPRTNTWSNSTLIKRTKRNDSNNRKVSQKLKNEYSRRPRVSDKKVPQGFMWLAALISLESIDLVL